MGASSRRQLRAAFGFIVRPLLFAVFLTVIVRLFSSNRKPRPAPETKRTKHLVIASTTADDTAWLSSVPGDWTTFNYVVDSPVSPELSVPANKGNEAMVYLTYIIANYDDLPDIVYFHHAHDRAWHQELDSLTEVTSLRAQYVVEKGYVSTRCLPGCENIIPLSGRVVPFERFRGAGRDAQLSSLLNAFVDRDGGESVPPKLAAPCCAQFAVSRAAIRRRTKEWWTALREWLLQTPLDSINSGRLLEHTWHVWLGQEAEHCPSYNECKCNVFGIGECDAL